MEFNFLIFGLVISYGVNFFLLYTRKKDWNSDKMRWILTGVLFSVGIIGFIGLNNENRNSLDIFLWCLMTPLIFNIFDRSFKKISEKQHGRDFYLWLRHSSEIDDSLFGKNPHIRGVDVIFSILLLFSILTLPIIGLVWMVG